MGEEKGRGLTDRAAHQSAPGLEGKGLGIPWLYPGQKGCWGPGKPN